MLLGLEITLVAIGLGFLWWVIRFIRNHNADDPEMDALWLALGPIGWLIRGNRPPPRR